MSWSKSDVDRVKRKAAEVVDVMFGGHGVPLLLAAAALEEIDAQPRAKILAALGVAKADVAEQLLLWESAEAVWAVYLGGEAVLIVVGDKEVKPPRAKPARGPLAALPPPPAPEPALEPEPPPSPAAAAPDRYPPYPRPDGPRVPEGPPPGFAKRPPPPKQAPVVSGEAVRLTRRPADTPIPPRTAPPRSPPPPPSPPPPLNPAKSDRARIAELAEWARKAIPFDVTLPPRRRR